LIIFTFRASWVSLVVWVLFAIDCFYTLLTLKWFSWLMDRLVIRRGWQLR
jgi:hypothetical protein